MLDFVRIGTRTAVITAIFATLTALLFGLYKLFALIPLPDVTPVASAFQIGFWLLHKYCPPLIWTIAFIGSLITFKLSVYAAYLINLAASWILRIFT